MMMVMLVIMMVMMMVVVVMMKRSLVNEPHLTYMLPDKKETQVERIYSHLQITYLTL